MSSEPDITMFITRFLAIQCSIYENHFYQKRSLLSRLNINCKDDFSFAVICNLLSQNNNKDYFLAIMTNKDKNDICKFITQAIQDFCATKENPTLEEKSSYFDAVYSIIIK